jgi:pyrroloquinoline quinone biosynthesis protein B
VINPSTGEILLVDATPDVRDQVGLLESDPLVALHGLRKPVDAIALTHAHMGHYAGLLHFGKEAASTSHVPVYATPRMLEFLLANRPFADLFDSGFLDARPTTPGKVFEPIAGVRLTPLLVPHREELSDSVGYLIEGSSRRLLYVPDIDAWDRWDRSLLELLDEVDYAILDGTFYSQSELPDRDLSEIPHPLVGTTMELLRGHEVRSEVWFSHLNHSNPVHRAGSTERKEVEAAGFFVAEDGVVFWL